MWKDSVNENMSLFFGFPSLSALPCPHRFILSPLCFFLDSSPELGSNPLKTGSIENGAFADLKRVSYIRIADTDITEIPKGKVIKLIIIFILFYTKWLYQSDTFLSNTFIKLG